MMWPMGFPSGCNSGRLLLTNLLLDTMKATAKESGMEGRVVIVSGAIYNFTPKGGIAFDKLINTNE
jgi:retinol dehydrogenase-12